LSLYGSVPEADYDSIVRELAGRRINLARPDASLLIRKPTESMEHGGGQRLTLDGDGVRRLHAWIEQGATRLPSPSKLVRLDVQPSSQVATRLNQQVPLQSTAFYSNASDPQDVTQWTVFTPEDASAVAVDPETGVATVLRRGRHIVTARYLDQVVASEIIMPLSDTRSISPPASNFIDHQINESLSTLGLPVSAQASDAEWLRRLTLDLTGRLPQSDAVSRFTHDQDPQKRGHLLQELMESAEFNEFWTFQFAGWFRIHSQPPDAVGARTYHDWLSQQISAGVGYDTIAKQLLTATHQVGPANFFRTVDGAREQAEFVSELFMGCRLRCANCHNHPLDRWTQDDYHGLAAILATVRPGKIVSTNPSGKVIHPRTGEDATRRIPGVTFLQPQDDGRRMFAEWLTETDNPYFAKAIVNRLWKAMMGRGLIEPTDDLRATNPPTHPRLLQELADDFIKHDFDFRHTLRQIAESEAYGRSCQTTAANAGDDRFYSHMLGKPLCPELLADAISDVLGIGDIYGDQPLGTRAVALFESGIPSTTLDILGRCSRQQSCESETGDRGGLPRKLHLFNGELLNQRIADPTGRVAQLIAAGKSIQETIQEFYLRALSREPTAVEREFWSQQLVGTNPTQQRLLLEDFVWSLLTCNEFITNH
jgi:Protein of unknown function (DUF1553)/Protein of unknown function (DUF1549)